MIVQSIASLIPHAPSPHLLDLLLEALFPWSQQQPAEQNEEVLQFFVGYGGCLQYILAVVSDV